MEGDSTTAVKFIDAQSNLSFANLSCRCTNYMLLSQNDASYVIPRSTVFTSKILEEYKEKIG